MSANDAAAHAKPGRGKPAPKMERGSWSTTILLMLASITVLLPLYVTISMAFQSGSQAVDGNEGTLELYRNALHLRRELETLEELTRVEDM